MISDPFDMQVVGATRRPKLKTTQYEVRTLVIHLSDLLVNVFKSLQNCAFQYTLLNTLQNTFKFIKCMFYHFKEYVLAFKSLCAVQVIMRLSIR